MSQHTTSKEITPWFKLHQQPVREGQYEGREVGSRLRVPVYWRTLTDESKPGWYFDAGALGPFKLWSDASKKITAWRGMTEESK